MKLQEKDLNGTPPKTYRFTVRQSALLPFRILDAQAQKRGSIPIYEKDSVLMKMTVISSDSSSAKSQKRQLES
ncbi:MAG: hypothetical protein BMS9Abin05_0139 [Rhodothermia bacterium]|nr:MAG: hypothetical protein BMS9Abin05_0139 [Rhodothermia bacterium]